MVGAGQAQGKDVVGGGHADGEDSGRLQRGQRRSDGDYRRVISGI